MIDVLINGINGRMGRAVYALASESKEISVVCGVDKKTIGNFNCPVYSDLSEFDGHADAVIDFSSPSSLDNLLDFCTQNGTA
ncbi:MAG: 4-hydroxy-tetrahydrodipicolinate reductase, partial [Clostridia bacterium]|nr:4-hydroxy-tetrahydrodipicolinate reductase [Clostridia bacterium]